MIGLEEPGPGKAVFHLRFSLSLQVIAKPVS